MSFPITMNEMKYCQRHNGPQGCVHITSSHTNVDPQFILRISNKHQHKISTKHQHLHKTSASESRLRINFITSTKHQQQNTDQTQIQNPA